ncbi:hypothetical protein NTE_01138 [Candidatus Nitrososphaera evergladensis SR1]|uniref:Uncharacterized protein n=1 Tax=Candidatus Nitrososphaera evergladensis SR1 TaxID=1459636 RepID=A0A075MNV4_9ARCH|nr:hypothetical protein [Candidatus Nitrososphaera evergladensis]AIF82372.1 hypothetical protein NTE_00290 [Candidatus Nitrososphaera evergladensis SR1]AIF83211.1 hypothetical protein NTE_01138 [Candidatus Nitrososphaera evergladensis SR1]
MKYYLDSEISKVAIIKTVESETHKKIWDILAEKGGDLKLTPLQIRLLVHKSLENFSRLHKNYGILPDDVSLMPNVENMYANIWSGGNTLQIQVWVSIKKKNSPADGPPRGNDLRILSTSAKFATYIKTELLTFDHDFIAFEQEIRKTFGLDIINGGTIPHTY